MCIKNHHSSFSYCLIMCPYPSVDKTTLVLKLTRTERTDATPEKYTVSSLEGKLASHGVTDSILNNQSTLKDVKKQLLKKDWECCVVQASQHASTAVAAQVASSVSWVKLWDMTLDYGPHGTKSLQALYRTLTRPSFQSQTRSQTCHL